MRIIGSNISHSFIDKQIFTDLSFSISTGQRIGLIGNNGTGKSTLLNIIAGNLIPENGKVNTEGKLIFIEQDSSLNDVNLSPGQQKLKEILTALDQNPDFLLLDEPTNHLDNDAVLYLLSRLKNFEGGLLIASHNRYFLDGIVNEIWEINNHKIVQYGGNYFFYKSIKLQEENSNARKFEAAKKDLDKIKNALKKENDRNVRAQVKGRKAKFDNSMPKIIKGGLKNNSEKSHSKIKNKLENIYENKSGNLELYRHVKVKKPYMNFDSNKIKGNLINIKNANLEIEGKILLESIIFNIEATESIAIIGKNGTGKSILFKAIANFNDSRRYLKGDYLIHGNVEYISQKYENVNLEKTIYENLKEASNAITEDIINKLIGDYFIDFRIFRNKKAKFLSGGEIARLSILKAAINSPDLLILDEPTNNLDISSVESLVNALNEYQGTLVLITHDAQLIEDLDITKIYEIKDKRLNSI